MAVDSPRGRQRVEIARAVLDAFNRADYDAARAHMHPQIETRVREGTMRGFAPTEAFMRAQTEQFAEFRIELNDAFEPADDTLVVCLTVTRRRLALDAQPWQRRLQVIDTKSKPVPPLGQSVARVGITAPILEAQVYDNRKI